MTPSAQVIGHGSQFELGTGSGPETFTPILGVTSIDLGSDKTDTHDVTDMSVAGNNRVFVGGLHNPGDVSIKFNLKPGDTSQASLWAINGDGLNHDFKVIYPGAIRTVTFSGIVSGMDESNPDDKIPTFTCKIQVSGAKVYS